MLSRWFERQWQQTSGVQCLLWPLSWLFGLLASARRMAYRYGLLRSTALPVPVIIVGNVSVGGVGKTPVVIHLAQQLRAAGYQPGILSRGYGGKHHGEVTALSDPRWMGDEPVLIARRTQCPLWVDPVRARGGNALLKAHPAVDLMICDDGLQHYALKRDVEIAVVQRPLGIGNGRLLPAGPLREPLSRLSSAHVVVETGQLPDTPASAATFQLTLQIGAWRPVNGGESEITMDALRGQSLVAVAGIGHPQRFFNLLTQHGLVCEAFSFPDHHAFTQQDFDHWGEKTILMTEKDAVKCQHLDLKQAWYLPVDAELVPVGHAQSLTAKVMSVLNSQSMPVKPNHKGSHT